MRLRKFRFAMSARPVMQSVGFLTVLLVIFFAAAGLAVGAEVSPATSFTVRTNINGDITPVAEYSLDDMKALTQVRRVYSSLDAMPAPNITLAEGVLLTDLLAHSNIDINKVQSIKLYSTDGWSRSYSKSLLYGSTRYYYPNIVANWDYSASGLPAFLPGAEDGAVPVEPMFAAESYQERFLTSLPWDQIESSQKFRFCFGQAKIDDITEINFGKWVNQMDVVLTDSSSPVDTTPVVSLSTPVVGQSYQPGARVSIAGTAQNLTSVELSVTGPGGEVACPPQNLDVAQGAFATDFTLADSAAEGDYTITVSKPGAPDDFSATFTFKVVKPAEVSSLTDIAGHWSENSVKELVALGVIGGYPDKTFRPDNTITRAEFVTLLVKAFKLEAQEGKVFSDTNGHWAQGSIATAAACGIVNGLDSNTFGPDNLVTREQMAAMIVKAAGLSPAAGEITFADNGAISAWAKEAIAVATGNGIMKGYPDQTFQPQGNATRAEAVAVISNALKI